MASNPRQTLKEKGNENRFHKREFTRRPRSQAKFQPPTTSGSNEIIEEVVSEMSCPVCNDHLNEPIFMCETGHNICGVCKKNLLLPVCPLCKNTVTGQRNFTLEAISSKLCIPCVNACHGCNYKCPSNTMATHMEECKFKPIDCPFKSYMKKCNWSGALNNFEYHFKSEHPDNITLKPGIEVVFPNFNPNDSDRDLQLISFDKSWFLYFVDINVEKKIGFWAIQMIGTEKDAHKWKYDFTFKNNDKNKYINFSNKCESTSVPIAELFESGNCVGIPLAIVENFLHENGKFKFTFFIRPSFFIHQNHRHRPNKFHNNDLGRKQDVN